MPASEKLSITLPKDMAEMVRGKVRAGAYASSNEVICEALRLLQEQEALKAQKLAWLREKVERALGRSAALGRGGRGIRPAGGTATAPARRRCVRLVFRPGAEADLADIHDHIADDSPAHAGRFVASLR